MEYRSFLKILNEKKSINYTKLKPRSIKDRIHSFSSLFQDGLSAHISSLFNGLMLGQQKKKEVVNGLFVCACSYLYCVLST